MTPQQICRKICKKSGSNFVQTFRFFGKEKREALEVFYAFCRLVDDAVDEAPNEAKAAENLKFWRDEIERIKQGEQPHHPVGLALQPVLIKYKIPLPYLHDIITGCKMDLTKKTYATFEELEKYCYYVASCVGLVCLHIFGVTLNEETRRAGIALGKALQLTNILRDISGDLGRGRIYLPEEDLKKFSVGRQDLANGEKGSLNLYDLLYFEIERAKAFYREAWEDFPKITSERKKLRIAFLMGRLYESILNKIAKDPLAVFRGKVSLRFGEKLKICLGILKM